MLDVQPDPKTTDPELLTAASRALTQIGEDLNVTTGRYPDPTTGKLRCRPPPLDLAVLAIQAQEALEALAATEVALARERDGFTWEQVGEAFGISTQSAHHRFANR